MHEAEQNEFAFEGEGYRVTRQKLRSKIEKNIPLHPVSRKRRHSKITVITVKLEITVALQTPLYSY